MGYGSSFEKKTSRGQAVDVRNHESVSDDERVRGRSNSHSFTFYGPSKRKNSVQIKG